MFVWTATYTAIAAAAVGATVSLIVAGFTLRHTRRTNKRELFVRLYEGLVDPVRQQGRQVLFEWAETGTRAADATPADINSANHAMAWFQLASFMQQRKHIAPRDARDIWGRTAVRVYQAAKTTGFIELRNEQHGEEIWPCYRKFYEDLTTPRWYDVFRRRRPIRLSPGSKSASRPEPIAPPAATTTPVRSKRRREE